MPNTSALVAISQPSPSPTLQMERGKLPNALDLKGNSALALQNGLALLRLPAHGQGERKNTGDTTEGID